MSPKILLVHPLGYGAARAKTDVSRMANIMPPLVSYLLYSCFFGKRIMQMAHKPLTIRGL